MKMRKCFANLHYWKNPVLRRAREKYTCVYVFVYMKIYIFSPQLGSNLSEGNFLMSYRTSKIFILPFEGAKLVLHVVPLLFSRTPASSFDIPTVHGLKRS